MSRTLPCSGPRRSVAAGLAIAVAAMLAAPAAAKVTAPRALHRLVRVTPQAPASVLLGTTVNATGIGARARAQSCARDRPVRLEFTVDGRVVGAVRLKSARWRALAFTRPIPRGRHRVSVAIRGARGCATATLDELRLLRDTSQDGVTPLGPHRHIPLNAAVPWDMATRADWPRDQTFLRDFDGLTPENAMKMAYVARYRGRYDFGQPDALVKYAADHGKTVRGHTLIWNGQLPGWFTAKHWSHDEMLSIMHDWIGAMVGRYKGRIVDWDVLNELFDAAGEWRDDPWHESLGPSLADEALRTAHTIDPGAKLFINDFDIERPGPKQDAVYRLVRDLKARGVPIDGVGIQAHWSIGDIVPEAMLLATMRRFATLGVQLELTELDITTDHQPDALTRQADAYAMAGRVCQSVSSCTRVTVWGIGDRDSWRGAANRPLLFDENFAAKPAYGALRAALDAG